MEIATAAGVIAAIVASIPGLVALIIQRRKITAEARQAENNAADLVTKAALSLVEPLRRQLDGLSAQSVEQAARIAALEKQVQSLERFADDLLSGSHRLVMQVRSLGGHPVYIPPERRE